MARLSPRAWRWPLALFILLSSESASVAQVNVGRPPPIHVPPGALLAIEFKEPVVSRVYQRDRNGLAEIAVVLDEDEQRKKQKIISARVTGPNARGLDRVRFVDGKLTGVPAGGPYKLECQVSFEQDDGRFQEGATLGPFFVGDLWVLAGQSNMEGVGDLIEVTPPHPKVMALGMDGKWVQAEEPLHWLVDSPDPVHSGDPETRKKRSEAQHKTRAKGAGLGLPFAVTMVENTGVPVGLVICAHGGTSMEQWSPSKKDEGGKSLYGSMLRQVKLAGGNVAGVLWYQGESDAMAGAAEAYPRVFADFIESVRTDFKQPELPFYFVQIGRFINGSNPKGWNMVQDAQRRLPDRVANTAVVAVVDLELDDLIHIGTQGLKRAGQRLARVALRELFGQAGATTPTLDRVNRGAGNTLVVKFKGVNMGPGQSPAPASGTMMMAGPGGPAGLRGPGRPVTSPGESQALGLRPARHIGGFSIRKDDGTEIPLIFDAAVGSARDTVVLKLIGPPPAKADLWYGYGLDPYCNLTDGLDMAVPVFGPVPLDEVK
jgi:sialate O-acetylesterase